MSLECRNVSKVFGTLNGPIRALEDVTFSAHEEEFVCIVGPSGCGKTTLLRLIAGLLEPTSGDIALGEAQGSDEPHAALVFQEDGLFPWKSLLDNVAFGLQALGSKRRERHDQALVLIEKVGLASFANNYPHELSVGMRQRANIARALASNPQILLMDEPFGSLDAQTKLVLQEELLRIWKEHKTLVVYVTHDIREAVSLGDRVLVMSGHPGRIRQEIPVPLGRPRHPANVDQPELMHLVEQIWQILQEEVRRTLWVRD